MSASAAGDHPRPEWRYWLWALGSALIGALLRWPGVRAGWALDDFVQQRMLSGDGYPKRAAWDLYAFVRDGEVAELIARGVLPWWSDPELRLRLFRPLSSLLLWCDSALFRSGPFGAHLVSLVCYSLLIVAAAWFFRLALPARAAWIATLGYALCKAHALPLAWVANRCAILAALFGALALGWYWRSRRAQRLPLASLGLYALALASAEYGVSVLGFLLGFELFAARDGARARLRALAPFLALTLVYAVTLPWLGFGVRATELYLDPLRAPGAFVARAVAHFPSLIADGLSGLPAAATHAPWWFGLLVLAAVVALLRLGVARGDDGDAARAGLALLVGGCLACIPITNAELAPRLLILPSLGLIGAVALVLHDAWRRAAAPGNVSRFGYTGLALPLLVGNFVVAPLACRFEVTVFASVQAAFADAARRWPAAAAERERVLLVAAPEVFSLHYPTLVRSERGLSVPRFWRVLSAAPGPLRITRRDAVSLELSLDHDDFFDSSLARNYRLPERGLQSGERISAGGMQVTVLARGRGPTRLLFQFPTPIEADTVLLASEAGGYRVVALPARGAALSLPPAQPPLR